MHRPMFGVLYTEPLMWVFVQRLPNFGFADDDLKVIMTVNDLVMSQMKLPTMWNCLAVTHNHYLITYPLPPSDSLTHRSLAPHPNLLTQGKKD
jgi:hypothetical protein